MRELSLNEVKSVNGGIVSLFWIGYGAYRAYKAYKLVRTVTQYAAAGAALGALKEHENGS
ncbi:hypothetical protein [Ferrimonas aestuarii]|uniref:Uncharacterized protein n=1 Tax=Ferrimonas aestuarii TaxID=2569539 RepID=A0A4U1BK09_9GAMM|nr:hypothetical protein [Ferrimonas aestuarii]TKB51810.1 hypothetical protein FCL42_17440 [Ferrimonas aestuarii]